MRGTPAPPLRHAGRLGVDDRRHPLAPWPGTLVVVVVGRPARTGPDRGLHRRGPDRWPALVEVMVVEEWVPRVALDVDGRMSERTTDSPFDLALARSVARSLSGPVQEVRRATPGAVVDRVRSADGPVAVHVPLVRGLRARWRRRRLRVRLVRCGAVELR